MLDEDEVERSVREKKARDRCKEGDETLYVAIKYPSPQNEREILERQPGA